ncbi:hypothetical protein [Deinococcus aetherius]|uniref:hypothetical protein n=1 Tax=Deinococcus aetherius TaxID=200252 RepID=UPI0022326759|nr:hypothetical protein [Deinococcus aetherius]
MTQAMTPPHPLPPLTSFWTPAGRLHVCPTRDGVYLVVDRYGADSQELTLSREQALDLLRLLRKEVGGDDR